MNRYRRLLLLLGLLLTGLLLLSGSYRIAGAVNPEATWREHGTEEPVFGYNISLAVMTDEMLRQGKG